MKRQAHSNYCAPTMRLTGAIRVLDLITICIWF